MNLTDVIAAIETTNNSSAACPDGVPAILLKKCKLKVAKPLVLLYNNLLRLGVTLILLKEVILHQFIKEVFKVYLKTTNL